MSSQNERIEHALAVIEASLAQFVQDFHNAIMQYQQWRQEQLLQQVAGQLQQQQEPQHDTMMTTVGSALEAANIASRSTAATIALASDGLQERFPGNSQALAFRAIQNEERRRRRQPHAETIYADHYNEEDRQVDDNTDNEGNNSLAQEQDQLPTPPASNDQ
ncbi:hypothetical protein BDB00DRAFT_872316 [Zychaea mexicana]|uniref:uncharacterized protein n=1 Tax=Zychaea mexicana TaxID=64656 RepID=UPI0022FE3195|nr:uncharacterized protein BDB00DRAFT_872316 [Zychaea mexicana]KAI9493427.1 hypothetical protein BDB00DRAFT_872316 [Zychaea mexicana]